ncbi:hypothetical protein L6164_019273 [Bauhinia variegata]|uniref:Uncharacterized protein n=1 Tax=Bauhinia variegata TaxID=167791 RepID=A0ACB9NHH0_BAUVA|nr:hypothetical protein L6164_019273 [Bauhinia variegata]
MHAFLCSAGSHLETIFLIQITFRGLEAKRYQQVILIPDIHIFSGGFKIMGRGRGKGKKLTVSVTNHEDPGSGEDEKVPAQKRRGRPQKPPKDEFDEEVEKIEEDESDNVKNGVSGAKVTEDGRKRKRNSQVKEKLESVEEENGVGNRSSTDELIKSNGFRHNGSRRKSKPRRAADAGVQCKNTKLNHPSFLLN